MIAHLSNVFRRSCLVLATFGVISCDAPEDSGRFEERDAKVEQTKYRFFDGRADAERVGLPRDRVHDYVETCSGSDGGSCSLWRCRVDTNNNSCELMGSYDDEGRDPAEMLLDERRAASLPNLSFVADANTFVAEAEDAEPSCHENSGSLTMCSINSHAGTLHCSLTVCGITSYYVCCGTAETDCVACG